MMDDTSEAERLRLMEQHLLNRHLVVDRKGRIRCPLQMWHKKGSFLSMKLLPKTSGSYIPVQCKWCKTRFCLAIQQTQKEKDVRIQRADLSRLAAPVRERLLLSL